MKRNVFGGLIIACIGAIFLGISGFNLMLSGSYANDIPQEFCDFSGCRPMQETAMASAIQGAIVGAIVTAIGLFFFTYGMMHQKQGEKRVDKKTQD